jgi:hypothetical protein
MFYLQPDGIKLSPSEQAYTFCWFARRMLRISVNCATASASITVGALQRQRMKNQRGRQIVASSFHFLLFYIILFIGSGS